MADAIANFYQDMDGIVNVVSVFWSEGRRSIGTARVTLSTAKGRERWFDEEGPPV